jgi:hypothetical protein
MTFELFDKDIEIRGTKYKFKPLKSEYLPKVYRIVGKLPENDTAGVDFLSKLEEKDYLDIIEMGTVTLQRSNPDADVEQIRAFVGQNLLVVMMGLIEVNVAGTVKDK